MDPLLGPARFQELDGAARQAEFTDFLGVVVDHRIRDLFRRVMQAWDCGPERPDNRQPLRPEHFPLGARGRDIVTRDGLIIATIAEPAMAEEITQRLNETEWKRQEGQRAL